MQITHDLAIGGLQQVVVNICKTINRERFNISVLCLRNMGDFVPEVERLGIKVFYLPQKQNGTDYFAFLKVAKLLREEKIDIIHTHNTQPFIDGTIGALLSGVKTIIHTDHSRTFPDKKRYMLAERLMSHFAYKVVGVSDYTSECLMRYEKISPKKIVTITNGIDESKYNIKINKNKKKIELGITKNGPIIGIASRLTEQKGIIYLLKAMPKIINKYPDITLVIAGEGGYKDILKKQAIVLGVAKNTIFLGPRLDIPELLKLFDVFVLPSIWEGLPMILLEAMAAGCSIVATNVGGVSTAIKHEENGVLIEPKNPEIIASEVIKLLQDKELRKDYAKRGLEQFKKKFSAKIMTEQYEKLYLREDK